MALGEVALRQENMSVNDMDEDIGGKSVNAVQEVHKAWLELNGSLSVLKTK